MKRGTHPVRGWLSSWRISVVIAARDARRNKGISALIMIMVGLPVAVVTGAASLVATADISPAESLDWVLGSSQARVQVSAEESVQQTPDALNYTGQSDQASVPVWTEPQMSRSTGGRAHEVTDGSVVLDEGGRDLHAEVQVLSPAGLTETRAEEPITGRWPSAIDEVAVSPDLADRGLTPGTSLDARPADGRDSTNYRIVGVAESPQEDGSPYDVVATDRVLAPSNRNGNVLAGEAQTFLITRPVPIAWTQITDDLNEQGLVVLSRDVIMHPEDVGVVPGFTDHWDPDTYYGQGTEGILITGIVLAILVETMLLAGPAFSISATRRRRSLVLLAANGGNRTHLRRHTLAQGLALGVSAALLGAVAGIAGAAALWWLNRQGALGQPRYGPFEVNLPLTAITALAASAAALIAAMIPARGAARLDVTRVLSDHPPAVTVRRRPVGALISAALAVAALAGCFLGLVSAPSTPRMWLTTASGVVAILAGVGGVSLTLRTIGRVRWGPLTARLALRETLRQRARTVPALAAVMASTATMTLLMVVVASDAQAAEDQYVRQAPEGQLILGADENGSREAVVAEIERQHPEWEFARSHTLHQDPDPESGVPARTVEVVPPGCSAEQAAAAGGQPDACAPRGSLGQAAVAAPAELHPGPPPSGSTVDHLDSGDAVVSDPGLITGGTITLAVVEGADDGGTVERTVRLAAVVDPAVADFDPYRPLVWMSADTAKRHELPTSPEALVARDPSGAISRHDADAITERVDTEVILERGYVSTTDQVTTLALLAAGLSLTLIGTLIATALNRAEARDDLSTMHAVGATRAMLRRVSAWSAVLICVIGSTHGILTGLIAGAALSAQLIGNRPEAGNTIEVVAIPSGPLGAGVLGVITLAGMVAWLSTRPALQPMRRMG